ncbi:MAG: hypothetical protein AAGD06_27865, partial [Acidobacteriota bacterium]
MNSAQVAATDRLSSWHRLRAGLSRGFPRWESLVAWISIVKCLLAVGAYGRVAIFAPASLETGALVHVLIVGTCGLAGSFLFLNGRGANRQAVYMGLFLLLIANAYAGYPASASIDLESRFGQTVVGLLGIYTEVFVAFVLWQFVRVFPEVSIPFSLSRLFNWASVVALVSGAGAFAIGLVRIVDFFSHEPLGQFWVYIAGLREFMWYPLVPQMFLAICALAYKQGQAFGREKRRSRLLVLSLVIGTGLTFFLTTIEVPFPPYLRFLKSYPVFYGRFLLGSNLVLLTVPFLTTYAVLA